jgi:single-stranded-DNA-specific exonuclease
LFKVILREKNDKLFDYHFGYTNDEILSNILSRRGMQNKLPTKDEELRSPFDFKEMAETISLLEKHIFENYKNIIINSDYDNDGFSGLLIFLSFVKEKYGVVLDYYINDRHHDGYELSPAVVEKFNSLGKKLIITIDKAVGSYDGVARARELGMDVIITDHHQPKLDKTGSKIRSDANNILCHTLENNPMQLCGAATVWYFCRAIDEKIASKYIDIAAIATIVDMVPMNDSENRKIVIKGLDNIRKNIFSNKNYEYFFKYATQKNLKEINIEDFSFLIGPMINATCKYDFAMDAIKYLVSDNDITTDVMDKIISFNEKRKEEVNAIVNLIRDEIIEKDNFLIVKSSSINHNFLGLIASRFENEYSKTTFVMYDDGEKLKCSARASAYNLQELFTDKYKTEIKGGGHMAAIGFELPSADFDQFVSDLEKNVLTEAVVYIDGVIEDLNDIKLKNVEKLQELTPYGPSFSEPTYLFEIKNINEIKNLRKLKDIHLSFSLQNKTFINFVTNFTYLDITKLDNYYAVGSLKLNKWNNNITIQIMVNSYIRKDDIVFVN